MRFFSSATPLLVLFAALFAPITWPESPRLTVILVIDQGAYRHFSSRTEFYQAGIKKLFSDGIVYTNAHMPHALPTTGVGHTALNTGTFANYHGICSNRWRLANGQTVGCDVDPSAMAAVINPRENDKVYSFGRSAVNMMVDGLSDQFVLSSSAARKRHAYAISGKSRSAIATAGHAAHALWFDHHAGLFTSSKAYMQQLPQWLIDFNAMHNQLPESISWQSRYAPNDPAYAMADKKSYQFSNVSDQLVNHQIPTKLIDKKGRPSYDSFLATPAGVQLILDCALQCVRSHLTADNRDEMLLWVCLSSLDPLGHGYGPDSLEVIDMLYHIDHQIGNFINALTAIVDENKILLALTADHGVSPIPELIAQKGFSAARRLSSKQLIAKSNNHIKAHYAIQSLITGYEPPYLYLNKKALASIAHPQQQEIIASLINFIEHQFPGIKKVWTVPQLQKAVFEPYSFEDFFQKQLYPGRIGDMVIQTFPYTLLTDRPTGTAHQTPYDYDTHVPLIIYQKGSLEKKVIQSKVFTTQFAPTIARILGIACPSASISPLLPGIFDK